MCSTLGGCTNVYVPIYVGILIAQKFLRTSVIFRGNPSLFRHSVITHVRSVTEIEHGIFLVRYILKMRSISVNANKTRFDFPTMLMSTKVKVCFLIV